MGDILRTESNSAKVFAMLLYLVNVLQSIPDAGTKDVVS